MGTPFEVTLKVWTKYFWGTSIRSLSIFFFSRISHTIYYKIFK